MRICFVGDPENTLMHRLMRYRLAKGHEVHVIAAYLQSYHVELAGELDGIVVHEIPHKLKGRRSFVMACLYVRSLLKQIRPDLVHIQGLTRAGTCVALSGFHPVVFTPWGADVLESPFRNMRSRIRTVIALRNIDAVVAASNAIIGATLRFSGPKPVFNVMWGVDTNVFRPCLDNSRLRRELEIPQSHQIVLSPRQLGYKYNIDVIVRAIPSVLKAVPRTTFVFKYYITQGTVESDICSLVEELQLQKAVRLVGRVRTPADSHRGMAEYFNLSNVFVSIPSWDGAPATIMEGLACGVTPIVSDILTNTEWITSGFNGLVVPARDVDALAEAVIQALGDSELRMKFVERNVALARAKAEYRQEMEKLEAIYRSLVDK